MTKNIITARTCVYNINYHVHAFVSAHPKVSVSYMMKMLKGISGRKLLNEFPDIKKQLWKGKLWNPSFYVETIGSVSEEAIKQYIDNQNPKKGVCLDGD